MILATKSVAFVRDCFFQDWQGNIYVYFAFSFEIGLLCDHLVVQPHVCEGLSTFRRVPPDSDKEKPLDSK